MGAMLLRLFIALLCMSALSGCSTKADKSMKGSSDATDRLASSVMVEPPEAWSLYGEPLQRPTLSPQRRADLDAKLDAALIDFDANPTEEDAIIWVGRRLAYLGQYREAIAMFTRGLNEHPKSYKLLRHRGHRFITLRRTSAALTDLGRAAQIVDRASGVAQLEIP